MPSSETYIGYGSGPWSRGSWGQDELAISVDGTQATSALGTVTVQAEANIFPTGVQGSGFVGVEDVDPITNVSLIGVEAEGQTGQLRTSFSFTATGVVASGSVGGYVVDPNQDNDGGWGSNEYGLGTWGGGVTYAYVSGVAALCTPGSLSTTQSVSVSGVEGEGELGTVVPRAAANVELNNFNIVGSVLFDPVGIAAGAAVTPAGFQNTVDLGQETVVAKANVFPTGVEGVTEIGPFGIYSVNNIQVPGFEAVGEVGNVTVEAKANTYVVGVQGTGQLGETDEDAKATVFLTGVQATCVVGTAVAKAGTYVQVTGVVGTMQLGETDESGGAKVYVLGVSGTGRVARPLVWGLIDTAQTPNWMPLAA